MNQWGVRFCANTLVAAFMALMMGYCFNSVILYVLAAILLFYGVAILYELIAIDASPAMGEVTPGEVQHLEQIERFDSDEHHGGGEQHDAGPGGEQPVRWNSPRAVGQSRGQHAGRQGRSHSR